MEGDKPIKQPRKSGVRIPPITMLFVGILVGGLIAKWFGALFGGVIGFFLWRSRA